MTTGAVLDAVYEAVSAAVVATDPAVGVKVDATVYAAAGGALGVEVDAAVHVAVAEEVGT